MRYRVSIWTAAAVAAGLAYAALAGWLAWQGGVS